MHDYIYIYIYILGAESRYQQLLKSTAMQAGAQAISNSNDNILMIMIIMELMIVMMIILMILLIIVMITIMELILVTNPGDGACGGARYGRPPEHRLATLEPQRLHNML